MSCDVHGTLKWIRVKGLTCARTHNTAAATPRPGRRMNDDPGRYSGRNTRYHRKYWLVQTLLNATKANVCASIVPGKFFLPRTRGIATAERSSCGRKARDSKVKLLWLPPAAER